jgi:hypothetical protein
VLHAGCLGRVCHRHPLADLAVEPRLPPAGHEEHPPHAPQGRLDRRTVHQVAAHDLRPQRRQVRRPCRVPRHRPHTLPLVDQAAGNGPALPPGGPAHQDRARRRRTEADGTLARGRFQWLAEVRGSL